MSVMRSLPEALEVAAANNCDVIKPAGLNELLLDLDGCWGIKKFRLQQVQVFKCLELLKHAAAVPTIQCWTSRSGNGLHVTIDLGKPMESLVECVAFQAMLGSDHVRDLFTIERWRERRTDDRMLFKPRHEEVHKGLKAVIEQLGAVELAIALKGGDNVNGNF